MNRWKGLACGAFVAAILTAPLSYAQAAEQDDKAPAQAMTAAPESTASAEKAERDAAKAEKKAAKAEAKAAKKAARAAAKAEKKREKAARYKTLFTDNGFTYYLDSKNSRWVPRPNSGSERMIEAWIRLVENTGSDAAADDGNIRPTKYFLEHYYISPQRREIMFISELEVTGRPENSVKERPYDNTYWEQLVPGSIEDDLFDAVVKQMKKAPNERSGVLSGTSGMSLRDMVEEFARISL